MSEMVSIPNMGLGDIESAMHFLRSAEIALAEFEKQINWYFTLLGRRASFLDRDQALMLAGRFEGYVNKCKQVHGSLAWISLMPEFGPPVPWLDEFVQGCTSSRKVNLKRVLNDGRKRLEGLRKYYESERAQLVRKQEFEEHLENQAIAESDECDAIQQ